MGPEANRSSSAWPVSNSIARYGRPCQLPVSNTVQMLGWLSAEAAQHFRVVDEFFRQDFEGHETPKRRVLCLEDDSHGAAADLFENAVFRNHLANHGVLPS